jgi:FlaA1/EpsC-like NDP-sugar epimerase
MARIRNRLILMVMDIILINLVFVFALLIRFEGVIGEQFLHYFEIYKSNILVITAIKLLTFRYFQLYNRVWRYASIEELLRIFAASIAANAIVLSALFLRQMNLPRSIYIIAILLDMAFIGGSRFSLRSVKLFLDRNGGKNINSKKLMIVGAGDAGAMIVREFKNHYRSVSNPVVMVDDDWTKHGQRINGVMIEGGREDIPLLVGKYDIDEIVISIPSASKKDISEIVSICKKTRANLKIVPSLYELVDGVVSVEAIRQVRIEDLLGREEVRIDIEEVKDHLKGKKVLVTGAGGSIGSELCRQIAFQRPQSLVMMDIYENTTYEIQNELKSLSHDLELRVYIASVTDNHRIHEILSMEKPDIIFHAAAHKHVPLMECNPKEAISNNVFGTWNLARTAMEVGVEKFVMISTDKAVNPTNVMGASKRLCEILVQSMNSLSKTEFVAVRFGNVLGSNGSVIPLFKKQIEYGGPVTVTHPDIIRYFMTIPEAVQLVLQAGAMANGGEIFVLDMGEPVKIMDLAEDLIRLSGFEPHTDIPIELIGLRPGEKLFEELLLDGEGILETKHDKIFVARQSSTDYEGLSLKLDDFKTILVNGSDRDVKENLKELVPNYTENNRK